MGIWRHSSNTAGLMALTWVTCLCGCERGADGYFGTVRPQHQPSILHINNFSEPASIDPGLCSEGIGGTLVLNLFAGLVQPHPKTLEPMPDVARRWKVASDGRRYTFFLRKTTWSDGTPVTASDFEWSWKRQLDPATGSKNIAYLWAIKNAAHFSRKALRVTGLEQDATAQQVQAAFEATVPVQSVVLADDPPAAFVYVAGSQQEKAHRRREALTELDGQQIGDAEVAVSVTDSSVVGVRALDAHTLEVDLERPVPYFLRLLSHYTALPAPKHVLDRLQREGQDPLLWTRVDNIVSNGAYRLKEWKFRQQMLLERNATYWDANNVRTPRIRLSMVQSHTTTINLYKAGELDWIGENAAIPNELMDNLAKHQDFHRSPWLTMYYYWLNTEAQPLTDRRVRKALSLALDRRSLTKHVTRAGQMPTADLVPDGLAGYPGLGLPLFDADRARALLAEAGFADGKGLPLITVLYDTSEGHKVIAEAAQQMWKKHLGIRVAIESQEFNVFEQRLQRRDYQVGRHGWGADYPDPMTFLELLTSDSGNNHSGLASAEYDALLDKANHELDAKTRLGLLRQAEALILEEQPIIPLYVYTRSQLWKPYVKGIWPNLQDRHPFKYMWIDERWFDGVPRDLFDDTPPPTVPVE